MKLSQWYALWRVGTPVGMGFIAGSLLSLALFPAEFPAGEEAQLDCPPVEDDGPMELVIRHQPKEDGKRPVQRTKPKVTRPRFYASELGIRDKLFAGILTTVPGLTGMALAHNKTGSHHVSKMVFFAAGSSDDPAHLAPNIVLYPDTSNPHLHMFSALDYIKRNSLIEHYDWFFLSPDNIYIKAFKLFEFVSHLNVGDNLLLGYPTLRSSSECDLSRGLVISRGVMEALLARLPDCADQSGVSGSEALAACLAPIASCAAAKDGKAYRTLTLSQGVSELSSADAETAAAFEAALIVGPVDSPADIYALHRLAALGEMKSLASLTASIEADIGRREESESGGSWPQGLPPPATARTRFEAFRWEFFTADKLFPNSAKDNFLPLRGVNAKDIAEVRERAARLVFEEEPDFDPSEAEMSGYRKFDPTRGMDYILDFFVEGKGTRRIHLSRPITRTELINVPYVTEKKEVLILLPIAAHEVPAARKFLDRFAEMCLEAGDDSRLLFILVHPTADESIAGALNHEFHPLIQDIRGIRGQLGEKKAGSSRVRVQRLRGEFDPLSVINEVVEKNGGDILYLLATPWVELHQDFLNRVRMHTINNFQVFFPVPFAQFNPSITRYFDSLLKDKPPATPAEIVVHKTSGHFDSDDFAVAGFYGADLRRELSAQAQSLPPDLPQLFAASEKLHFFRAVDPSLKTAYHAEDCEEAGRLSQDTGRRCERRAAKGLASRPQLAALLLRHSFNASQLSILARKNRA